jgi:hypothetical protein
LRPSQHDHLEISYYSGEDILRLFRDRNNDGDGFLTEYTAKNNAQSLQWRRQLQPQLTAGATLFRSQYKYNIRNTFATNELLAVSDIEDLGARWYIQNDSLGKGSLKAGLDWTRHNISPNVINTAGLIAELLASSSTQGRVANEFGAYTSYSISFNRWDVSTGLRYTMTIVPNKVYHNPEPRFSTRYAVSDKQAVKLSYSRMVQYLHRISNSAVTSPTDIWYPVTDSIRPQTAHQVALAWQRLLPHDVSISIEGYYKKMSELVGFEEGTNLFFNTDFASSLIQGRGKAYGAEFLIRKDIGRLSGWLSYTLSWSWRQFDGINQGLWFPSRYDRRHNGAIVAQYAISKRWAASMVWEYISGARFTPIIGQYIIFAPSLTGVDLIPVFSGVNQVKLSDSHRLDVGVKFKSNPERKFQWQWFVGVYNAYNRSNPVGITIEQDENDGSLRYYQPGLFGLLPFISYGFKF